MEGFQQAINYVNSINNIGDVGNYNMAQCEGKKLELMENLTAPMNEIANVMAKLASGDIRGRITGDYAGELKALKANVNRSLDATQVSCRNAIALQSHQCSGNFDVTILKDFFGN